MWVVFPGFLLFCLVNKALSICSFFCACPLLRHRGIYSQLSAWIESNAEYTIVWAYYHNLIHMVLNHGKINWTDVRWTIEVKVVLGLKCLLASYLRVLLTVMSCYHNGKNTLFPSHTGDRRSMTNIFGTVCRIMIYLQDIGTHQLFPCFVLFLQ